MTRQIREGFPGLERGAWRVTSPKDPYYNCICWAADPEDKRWWWPDPMYQRYWPPGVPREPTVAAFREALGRLGFEESESPDHEEGVEKVALFVRDGEVRHAARQLPGGRWTSKLGELEDIEHNSLEGVAGETYGVVAAILGRPRQGAK